MKYPLLISMLAATQISFAQGVIVDPILIDPVRSASVRCMDYYNKPLTLESVGDVKQDENGSLIFIDKKDNKITVISNMQCVVKFNTKGE